MPQPAQPTFPTAILNDGREMPQFGYGTLKVSDDEAEKSVSEALNAGYRLIDTAAIYENEEGVGKALANRHDIFLTTKVWNDSQGHAEAKTAFRESLRRLGRDEVDLLLIHWPCASRDLYVDTWKALIELREDGRVKSIGVSNFLPEHIDRLIEETGVTPTVNQIELHPYFQQREARDYHRKHNIITQAWSPLGRGALLDDPVIKSIAEEMETTPAAVILRWHLQSGTAPIPKTSSPDRMRENASALQVFLNRDQMGRIDALDRKDGRIGPDPVKLGNEETAA
ncbi:aldo/keto reductase [Croceicoccus naphthovorans]|uniref:NADP-dependent oxidoreductase domain-containing protein n=1 Tax=Croceicoccus naphthovorans TaxID=1348774 RepID=A0A0G3XFG5_9SPHN|nr:aldo/keto reductase [Croceicoccus naphthovorans]AKM09359.1 hypothetical protein AB433_04155 [Croceicoccus naphthovorans]MBB3990275.1 2,5-diketo-D-gluconate reductase A [Croceicoccus naphthovorans]